MSFGRIPSAAALLLLSAMLAHAAFEEVPGKRIAALGGAGAADGGDPLGFYTNPAASAWGVNAAFETQYARHFWGLEGDNLSKSAVGGFIALGAWGNISLGYDAFTSKLYKEERFVFGYGRKFNLGFGTLASGVNAAMLGRSYVETPYTAVDPLFVNYGYSRNSIGLDLGAQLRTGDRLAFGLALRRLNAPNQAIEKGVEDPLPRVVQTGVELRFGNLNLLGDIEYRDIAVGGTDFTPRVGVEYSLFKQFLHLRAGFNRDDLSFGFGINAFKQDFVSSYTRPLQDGGSERVTDSRNLLFRVGYTFRYPIGGVEGTTGHHLLGIDIFFDRKVNAEDMANENLARPRVRRVIQTVHDTVYVKEPEYIHMVVADTAQVKALEAQLDSTRKALSSLANVNEALQDLERALELYYKKEYSKAIDACNHAIDLVPTLALGYVRKGSIYFAMGRREDARKAWQMGLRYEPNNTDLKEYLKQLEPPPSGGR